MTKAIPETNTKSPTAAAAKPAAAPEKTSENGKTPVAAVAQPGASTNQSATGASVSYSPAFAKSWDEIRVGSLVLTPANDGAAYGWWEAEVMAMTNGLLTLRCLDYPREPIKARRRHEVALPFAK